MWTVNSEILTNMYNEAGQCASLSFEPRLLIFTRKSHDPKAHRFQQNRLSVNEFELQIFKLTY